MGSMAFWYDKDPNKADIELKSVMNFNLWTQCSTNGESFLDIGFNVFGISAAKKLHYYIPFDTDKADVKDLSLKINNSKAIGAIFNEKYSVIDIPTSNCFWPVQNGSDQSTAFVIYSWAKGNTDNIVQIYTVDDINGFCHDIDVEKFLQKIKDTPNAPFTEIDKFYFRFRVPVPHPQNADTIVRKYTPPNSFLQSTLATTYIVDFRFDDLRSLPEIISNKIIVSDSAFVPVSKLHFLLMTKAHVDVETGAQDASLRELEEGVWEDYIETKFNTKDVVAYHCAEKVPEGQDPIKQWEFFAKLKVNNSTWSVVSIYLFALGIITICFNLLSNLLLEWLKNIF